MIEVESFKTQEYDEFEEMFLEYFIVDIGVKYDKEKLRENLIKKTILKQYEEGLIFIDMVKNQGDLLGFIIYQIDREESDWKERLGDGFIREFYIKREFRKQGLGSRLLNHAEQKLKDMGAREVYLTSKEDEGVKAFYQRNGYNTDHSRSSNGNEYFEKQL